MANLKRKKENPSPLNTTKNTKNNSYKKKLPITTIAIKKRPKMNEPPYTKQKEKT